MHCMAESLQDCTAVIAYSIKICAIEIPGNKNTHKLLMHSCSTITAILESRM